MLAGILPALVFPYFFDGLDLYYFPLLLLLSLAGSIIGTFIAPPTDPETLKRFYRTVRPWGYWKPIADLVKAEDPSFKENKDFWIDAFNVVVGIAGQMCLTLLPIYLVIGFHTELLYTLALLLLCGLILKKTWWVRLPEDQPGVPAEEQKELVSR